jgi:peptidoglycan hydrolase-like protein with peptidoglycan-binding domain
VKPDFAILQLQTDLLALGFDPKGLDGRMGDNTRAAMKAFAKREGLDPTNPGFYARVHEEATEAAQLIPASFDDDTDDGPSGDEVAPPACGAEVGTVAPVIYRVKGKLSNRKPDARDLTKKQRVQLHITDYWPGENCVGMKTNLYVSEKAVYEVHPLSAVIVKNYSDLYHIEVAGVTKERRVVVEKGVTYSRRVMIWTPEREALLEMAMVYTVESFRAAGVEPEFCTHRQTYKKRAIDPEIEIAQAAYRIAARHGFRLDYEWTRGSGQSAEKWYPAGAGRLG